ncbi:MAG TPA: hypothetical protein VG013_19175 [Gemmataceae bacterium]|jgi:hypothetical protein|nr:hypothetical protein [Gemmataceae bacterium]
MRFLMYGSLVLCLPLALAGSLLADGQADCTALIDKAIKAMGGSDKVAKLQAGTGKGKITGQDDGKEITVTYEVSWQGLDQYRIDADAQFDGNSKQALVIVNGAKGWFKSEERVEAAPKGLVSLIKDTFYGMRMPQLLPVLKGKGYKLSPLGELKVGGHPALGVRVVHKDHKDVSLFFDKKTGLPVKSEISLKGPDGKELALEYLYSDYKDFDGVQHCTQITIKADGKEFTMEMSELTLEDKLDDSVFDKP